MPWLVLSNAAAATAVSDNSHGGRASLGSGGACAYALVELGDSELIDLSCARSMRDARSRTSAATDHYVTHSRETRHHDHRACLTDTGSLRA
jgi:hypothetical protein